MKFFKKFGEKLGIVEENKTEKIREKRAQVNETLANNLKNIGFTQEEVDEVFKIIKKCDTDIQNIKDEMIGTNINNEFAVEVTQSYVKKIRDLEDKMGLDVRAKIAEIRQRKNI